MGMIFVKQAGVIIYDLERLTRLIQVTVFFGAVVVHVRLVEIFFLE